MKKKYDKESLWLLGMLIVIAVISITPFIFRDGIHSQDDLVFHKERLENYYLSVKQWDFFPKIFPNMANGYGYGADLFYPSLFLLPFALFRLLGLPFVQSYYLFQFTISLATALSSFYVFKRLTSQPSGYIGALLYTLSTYRLIDQSVRGALGETLAFIFLPLVLLGLYDLCFRDFRRWQPLAFGLAGVISCHLITAFYTTISVILVCLITLATRPKELRERLPAMIKSGLLAGFLSAWVLLPILEQVLALPFNVANAAMGQSALTYPFGTLLLNSLNNVTEPWSTISPNLGISLVAVLGLAFATWRRATTVIKITTFVTLAFFIMSSNLFPWSLFKDSIFGMIQFPWRLLTIASLTGSLLASLLIQSTPKVQATLHLGILTSFVLLITLGFNAHVLYQVSNMGFEDMRNDNYVAQRHADIGYGQEYLLQGSNYDVIKEADTRAILIDGQSWPDSDQRLVSQRYKTTLVTFPEKAISQKAMSVSLPFFYYLGYHVYTDAGTALKTAPQDGLLTVSAPAGTQRLHVLYKATTIQLFSLSLSAICLGLTVVLNFYTRQTRRWDKPFP